MEKIKNYFEQNVKHKQYVYLGLIILALLGISCLVVLLGEGERTTRDTVLSKLEGKKRIELSGIVGGQRPEHQWIYKSEKLLESIDEKLTTQQKENQLLEEKVSKLENVIKAYEESKGAANLDSLALEIARLREELESVRNGGNGNLSINSNMSNQEFDAGQPPSNKIQQYEVNLGRGKAGVNSFSLNSYIPAGSYVSSVVISGVDASVGISSQSEPRPVLFRVTGKAKSAANDGEIQEVDIAGCVVTGAASGDLSSEKVFIRLLKMTCSRESGKAFETTVQGYVAGLGKAGIRGDVVSREGDFVFKSFLAGIATGAGNGLAQRFINPIALPTGLATQQPSMQDIIGSGVGKGIESSSSRLSDYLIKRAEQYQPVISIPSGIEVELVFNDGVYLDGKGGTDEIKKIN